MNMKIDPVRLLANDDDHHHYSEDETHNRETPSISQEAPDDTDSTRPPECFLGDCREPVRTCLH